LDDAGSRKKSGLWGQLNRFISGRKKVTEEEIQELMDAGEEEGIINEEENAMIRSIFALGDTVVREVMVPRTDMACIPIDAPVRDVLDTIIECGHSRIPVYEGTMDNIVGLLYAKDLLKLWGRDEAGINLRSIMRPSMYIPESKNLEEMLQEFRRKRIHLAIVVDEYGGTSGLLTIEDLLEEIVGDIQDEYDTEEELLVEEAGGSVLIDARLPIEELEEHFGIKIEREKFDTVGGLAFHLTGRIPESGEVVKSENLLITVLEADERRVIRLRVERLPETPGED
jgi:CBS domain containing-hemolysin-like protein